MQGFHQAPASVVEEIGLTIALTIERLMPRPGGVEALAAPIGWLVVLTAVAIGFVGCKRMLRR